MKRLKNKPLAIGLIAAGSAWFLLQGALVSPLWIASAALAAFFLARDGSKAILK